MTDLFDEVDGSEVRHDPLDEKEDLDIKQVQEAVADSNVEVTLKTITPQKLEGSRTHEFLTRDALLANLPSAFDIEVGTMYHALACNLQYIELVESAQAVNSEHTSWLDHSVSLNGFGRRLLSTTTIDRSLKTIKEPVDEAKAGMKV